MQFHVIQRLLDRSCEVWSALRTSAASPQCHIEMAYRVHNNESFLWFSNSLIQTLSASENSPFSRHEMMGRWNIPTYLQSGPPSCRVSSFILTISCHSSNFSSDNFNIHFSSSFLIPATILICSPLCKNGIILNVTTNTI